MGNTRTTHSKMTHRMRPHWLEHRPPTWSSHPSSHLSIHFLHHISTQGPRGSVLEFQSNFEILQRRPLRLDVIQHTAWTATPSCISASWQDTKPESELVPGFLSWTLTERLSVSVFFFFLNHGKFVTVNKQNGLQNKKKLVNGVWSIWLVVSWCTFSKKIGCSRCNAAKNELHSIQLKWAKEQTFHFKRIAGHTTMTDHVNFSDDIWKFDARNTEHTFGLHVA